MIRIDADFLSANSVFSFKTPEHVLYGRGSARACLEKLTDEQRHRVAILVDAHLIDVTTVQDLIDHLRIQAEDLVAFERKSREPLASDVDELAHAIQQVRPTAYVGIGGGATIDTVKAVRALRDGGSITDLSSGDREPADASTPLVAVATTAGTGSETGMGAVFTADDRNVKDAIYGCHLQPTVAVVDPDLHMTMPPRVTADSGLDALAQSIGPVLTPVHQPLSEVLGLEAVSLIGGNLERVYVDGQDLEARCGMAYGALLMGLAMNNSECTGEHFFAEVVGPRYGLPHGQAVAIFTSYVLRFNASVVPRRLAAVGRALAGTTDLSDEKASEYAIVRTQEMARALEVPTLAEAGVTQTDLKHLAEMTAGHFGNTMGINPRPLTAESCLEVLTAAFDSADPMEIEFSDELSI